jgi:hypothetical protein
LNPELSNEKNSLKLTGKKMSMELSQMNDNGMKRLMATERIIDEALKMLDTDPYSDIGNWPADASSYKGEARLSESKMKNEIDHREPRTKSFEGRFTEYPICSTEMGNHSSDRRDRKSEIEDLGEGTVLYFKFLKYWMFIFFMSTLLSGPALAVFLYGMQYDQLTEPFYLYVARSFMGNMGSYMDMSCTNANLPPTKNRAAYIGFKCGDGRKLKSLQHFGLANANQTCVGHSFQKKVNTIDRCSMGTSKDAAVDKNLQDLFKVHCKGKSVCSMYLEYDKIFTSECIYEINRRMIGRSPYGPAKVYGIAQCEKTAIRLGQI